MPAAPGDPPTFATRSRRDHFEVPVNSTRWLWLIALLLTLVLARWQRVSGPTYPLSGVWAIAGDRGYPWQLERSHAGPGDHLVKLATPAPGATGTLEWRAHESSDAWTAVPMTQAGDSLVAPLPHQAPGLKLDYRVTLAAGSAQGTLPPAGAATLRFRNDVPSWVLIPHILVMMGVLLLSTRAAFEAFRREPQLKFLTLRTLAALVFGGFILGCVVSGYAFGQPWGGFPISNDPTDNKTLIAFIAWVIAAVPVFRGGNARPWVVGAAIVTIAVFVIPHSVTMPK
jgi:hypothetical protein